ncbi:MAG: response regulator [Lentisphaeraceae bacterium]|nr:response regulator [Lentisphaeraceae bacterium]
MESKRQRLELSYNLSPVSGELHFSSEDIFGELEIDVPLNTSQWQKNINDKDQKKYDTYLDQLTNSKGAKSEKYRITLPCGENILVQDRAGLIEQKDRWPIISGTISEVALEQEQMEHIEKLSLMGNLSAGLIHDFKNLMGGVQNIIEWCILESNPQPSVSSALAKTIDYLDQANALMVGLLKLNENAENESPVAIRLDKLVKDFEMLLKHICSAAIRVELKIDSNLKPIMAHACDMQEIFLNLCVNSRNAMEAEGDSLIVDLRNVVKDGKPFVCMSIIDNGCGIPDEKLGRIFDAYYTSSGKGTGLGLWMVRKKVREMQGDVEVKSKVGVGTTFTVTIPASEIVDSRTRSQSVDKEDLSATTIASKTSFTGGETILFVEDEPLIHSSVCQWLESLGLNVLAAQDGNTALKLFEENEHKIDLILQDWILPGVKGEDLLAKFSASENEMPIIVMSAYSGAIDNSGILSMGASSYLPKPFKINQLIDLLKDYLK